MVTFVFLRLQTLLLFAVVFLALQIERLTPLPPTPFQRGKEGKKRKKVPAASGRLAVHPFVLASSSLNFVFFVIFNSASLKG